VVEVALPTHPRNHLSQMSRHQRRLVGLINQLQIQKKMKVNHLVKGVNLSLIASGITHLNPVQLKEVDAHLALLAEGLLNCQMGAIRCCAVAQIDQQVMVAQKIQQLMVSSV
jgi:hypothetical protein